MDLKKRIERLEEALHVGHGEDFLLELGCGPRSGPTHSDQCHCRGTGLMVVFHLKRSPGGRAVFLDHHRPPDFHCPSAGECDNGGPLPQEPQEAPGGPRKRDLRPPYTLGGDPGGI